MNVKIIFRSFLKFWLLNSFKKFQFLLKISVLAKKYIIGNNSIKAFK